MKYCVPIQNARCPQQAVHNIRYPLHRTANARAAVRGVRGTEPVAHFNKTLGVSIDDREWSSKFMGSHGNEIPLLRRQSSLVLEPLLQRRVLFNQSTLAFHESHCGVAENSSGARHLPHLIFASDA